MGYGSQFLALLLATTTLVAPAGAVSYSLLREYSGNSFFDRWDFYGNVDDTTHGNVMYLNRRDAFSSGLAAVNSAENVIMKVDDTTYVAPAPKVHRASVRITSQDTYGAGNLLVLDALHIPYGCSVWPGFWTRGAGVRWPDGGEIDIVEAINLMNHNQYVLHTTPGCMVDTSTPHTGKINGTDCSVRDGCVVAETKANSYGAGFAQAGGGVYATQIDVSGINIWFWSRPDVPNNIQTATSTSTLDTSTWGPPSAAYSSTTCDFNTFFTAQQLIFTTTLCGHWAGVTHIYDTTCHTPTNSCVNDNVIGPGHPTYDNAYWEISSLRVYAPHSS
ncbi:glycoside hydrolase family 16 protein [Amanita rubescens]|nr:glycoside hydrolase family 16 protein [Amanita rubescens]KAF8351771.1 glycoside hydrolase family 16 protein [Amanita rubescens]